ncbi:hypothetical protein CF319_g3576 [Tilletia indica]|nr:hypothetical protein CF319_g3576 [Tilletia indica]
MPFRSFILLSAIALAASTRAATFGDQFCKDSLCISAVYDDQAMAVSYKAVYTGSPPGWIGVGQGGQMAGANMMVGWPASDGQVVLSQRSTPSHASPNTKQVKASTFVPHADASKTNSSMTILSWTFPVQAGFASSKTSHIWATSPVSPKSTDASAAIARHDRDGIMELNLTQPFPGDAPDSETGFHANSSPTASQSSSSSDSGQDAKPVIRDLSMRPVRLFLAHMIVMSIAWMGLVPAGILIGRFGRTVFPNSWFKIHRGVQVSAVLLTIIGFALAVSAVGDAGLPHFNTTHQRAGLGILILVLIQALWGQIGHVIFRSRGSRVVNYGHILLGVILFFGLSLWQIRTGLQIWLWSPPRAVGDVFFPLWFALITAAWLLGLLLVPRQHKSAIESREKIRMGGPPSS